MQRATYSALSATVDATGMQPMSLKALAEAVLARNATRNVGTKQQERDATPAGETATRSLRGIAAASSKLPEDLQALIRSVCAAHACLPQEIDVALNCAQRDHDAARESFKAMARELD